MRANILNVGLFVTWFILGGAIATLSDTPPERTAKHFSLFSVVTFKNEECTSETSITGGATQGTCYTSTECSDKNGMKSGNCASGFGVCCVFLDITAATGTITNNRTRLRNAEFPAVAAAVTLQTIVYTLQKMSSDICQIRLDFDTFVIAGPANTLETILGLTWAGQTHCINDFLTFVQTGGALVPHMCGSLTGEHIYLDLGADATDTSVMTITTAPTATITPANAARVWDVKLSQIECYATYRAPSGCHRYLTTDTGKIASLNFRQETNPGAILNNVGGNTGIELASQYLQTCIRRSKGMCCVEYQLCTSHNGAAIAADIVGTNAADLQGTFSTSWSIDMMTSPMVLLANQVNAGQVDGGCSGDYVEIPSSWSGSCGANGSARYVVTTRYCGAGFGANFQRATAAAKNTPVCDCSEPFTVTHSSDMADDNAGTGNIGAVNGIQTQLLLVPRGFCLDFNQQPCYY